MDKLSFIRITDRPGDVVVAEFANETFTLFPYNGKTFCFHKEHQYTMGWLAELTYDKATANEHCKGYGNPGGYKRERLELVWVDGNFTRNVKEFIGC